MYQTPDTWFLSYLNQLLRIEVGTQDATRGSSEIPMPRKGRTKM